MQPALPFQDSLLEKQIYYLQVKGPSLGMFVNFQNSSHLFTNDIQNNPQLFSFCQKETICIKLLNHKYNNIRIFYYYLLYACFQDNNIKGINSKQLLDKFKKFAYSNTTKIDKFRIEQIPGKYRQFYENNKLKKLLVEFLQVMNYNRNKGSVLNMINKYEIMDFIFIILIKCLVSKYQIQQKQSNSFELKIQTYILAKFFQLQFGFQIKENQDNWIFLNNNFIYEEGQEFSKLYSQTHTFKRLLSMESVCSRQMNDEQLMELEQNRIRKQQQTNNLVFDKNINMNLNDSFVFFNKTLKEDKPIEQMENFSFGKKKNQTNLQKAQSQVVRNKEYHNLNQHDDVLLIIPAKQKDYNIKIINDQDQKKQITNQRKEKSVSQSNRTDSIKLKNKSQSPSNFQTNKSKQTHQICNNEFSNKSIKQKNNEIFNVQIKKPLSSKGSPISRDSQYSQKNKDKIKRLETNPIKNYSNPFFNQLNKLNISDKQQIKNIIKKQQNFTKLTFKEKPVRTHKAKTITNDKNIEFQSSINGEKIDVNKFPIKNIEFKNSYAVNYFKNNINSSMKPNQTQFSNSNAFTSRKNIVINYLTPQTQDLIYKTNSPIDRSNPFTFKALVNTNDANQTGILKPMDYLRNKQRISYRKYSDRRI